MRNAAFPQLRESVRAAEERNTLTLTLFQGLAQSSRAASREDNSHASGLLFPDEQVLAALAAIATRKERGIYRTELDRRITRFARDRKRERERERERERGRERILGSEQHPLDHLALRQKEKCKTRLERRETNYSSRLKHRSIPSLGFAVNKTRASISAHVYHHVYALLGNPERKWHSARATLCGRATMETRVTSGSGRGITSAIILSLFYHCYNIRGL